MMTRRAKLAQKLENVERQIAVMESERSDSRGIVQRLTDGWANVFAGLGFRGDKRERTHFRDWRLIQDPELQTMYLGDGVATRIVDIIADDMTREWIDLEADSDTEHDEEGDLEAVRSALDEIDAEVALNLAVKWARLYGGALIVMGVIDGQTPDQPLDYRKIRGFSGLRIVDRVDVHIWNSIFDTDVMSSTFGQPIVYDCIFHVGTTRVEQYVHASRCIPMFGRRVPQNSAYLMNMEHRYWGVSELQFCYEQLRDFGGIRGGVANLLYEIVIGKYSIAGLADMIASGNERQVISRMEQINMSKSIINAVLLDADGGEKYERDSITLTGVPEVIDRFMMMLSSVTGIPVTRLFGRSAAGMNSTGEGDDNNYDDMIRSKQKTQLKPAIHALVNVIKAWKHITTDIEVKFNPLTQTTAAEEADIEAKTQTAFNQKAQGYAAFVTSGALSGEDIRDLEWTETLAQNQKELAEKGYTPAGMIGDIPSPGEEVSLANDPTVPLQPPVVQKVPPEQQQQREPQPPTMVPLEQTAFVGPTSEEGGGPS